MSFKEVSSQQSFPELEQKILKFWDEDKTFLKSIENRENSPSYSFYDGPPFATGTPHYGHIVASTMKDVMPRYFSMRGFKVERKWGWDCHGLPIENIAEKELGIKQKKDIENMGVEKFNEVCRSKVLTYVTEWEKVIHRLGRWADMKNAYKTMDLGYMESVWWTFKQLWDKNLIYESYRSMHICPRCETTLSQSEVAEGYKNIKDLSVIAKFKLKNDNGKNKFILAWTTTPWTLIGNVALAINPRIQYVEVKNGESHDNKYYIVAKDRVKDIFKDKNFEITKEYWGQDLINREYEPLFDYYFKDEKLENHENGWKIYPASFVTTEEGTGIVHIAPAFGEDDMNLSKDFDLPFIQHVGMDGIIKKEAGEFAGLSVKPAEDVQKTDVEIIKYLAGKDLLFSKEQYEHSYPHCWRCETPLINYATTSWFVKITALKEEAIELAKKINWSPKHIKDGRFGKWLEGARDWSISRQRYWASCIPLWRCKNEKCNEIKVIGSIEELENLSGQKITDLHKDKIDPIEITCEKCSGTMRRIPDVLDTWFDSGSMPFAQNHYPFENKEKFLKTYPAEFIGEGVDQTRAWFYYLHIIATAICKNIAYKNVIVNGIVLAEDGKKMSKRLNNYPDPMAMFDKYGADVMRFYLLTTPVMQAENLNFSEKDMSVISSGIFRMLWNSYSFFVLYANIDKNSFMPKGDFAQDRQKIESKNILDQWILSEINILIQKVNSHMEKYELVQAARLFTGFIDDFSNWYIRRSRKRFKSENLEDKNFAYQTLYEVLITLSKVVAPFTPFIAEEIYQNLAGDKSVHLTDYPKEEMDKINSTLNQEMKDLRKLVEQGLSLRAEAKIRLRQPLAKVIVKTNLSKEILEILKDEINVKEVEVDQDIKNEVELDTKLTDVLLLEGNKNDILRLIQGLRKKANLNPSDFVSAFYKTSNENCRKTIEKYANEIKKEASLKELLLVEEKVEVDIFQEISEQDLWLGIKKSL